MMDDRELLEQAVEKLEFFAHMKGVSEDTKRLITALRERLAQPEQKTCLVANESCKHGSWCSEVYCQEHCKFVEQSAQPEQEPSVDVRAWFTTDEINAWADKKLKENPQWAEQPAQRESVKFNCTVVDDAHPEGVPLSQWGRQPLTEATIRGMCERVPDYDISTHDLIQFARAIERAHGIKGQP